jgi:oxalate---CoA ligase
MRARSLLDLVEDTARSAPERPALGAPGRSLATYGALAAHARGLASQLAGEGLGRMDRIVLAVPDGADAAVAVLAASSAGVAVPIPPATPEDEAARLFGALEARALVVPREGAQPLARAARARGLQVIEMESRPGRAAGLFELLSLRGSTTRVGSPEPQDVAVLLHTSGTTTAARRVALRHEQLWVAGRDGCAFMNLGPQDQGLCFAPIFHLAGLYYALVYPLSSAGSVFVTPGLDAARFFDWYAEARPTYFAGSPTAHRAILERATAHMERIRAGRLRFIRSAAAHLSCVLHAQLEATFRVPVLDSYALTEAGLVASMSLDLAERRPGTIGRPVADAEVRIVDASGGPVPPNVAGEIVVRGSKVMRRYEGDPEATRAAFYGDWLRTGDEGVLDAEGFLRVTGRLRERINRGGEKIAPVEVDEALLAHPAVAEAAAFGITHQRLGEDLAAVVRLRPGAAASPAELRRFVADRLAPFKVPSRFFFSDRIPRGPTGKILRARLASLLHVDEERATDAGRDEDRAAGSKFERRVAREMAMALGRASVGLDDDFFDCGGDSVGAASLVARLDEEFGVSLPASVLFEAPSTRTLARRVVRPQGLGGGPLVPLGRRGDGRPLYFVHAIGGGALLFAGLAERLESRPFYGLQAPGFDGRQPPLEDLQRLARHYLDAIEARQPGGPYLLGGFCMGAAVAFEMARLVEARGERVALVVMLDPPPLPLGSRRRVFDRARVTLHAAWARLHGRQPGTVIAATEPPVVQANRRALRSYRPGRIRAPLLTIFSEEGPPGPALEAEHALRRLTTGAIHVGLVKAGHKDLFAGPALSELAAQIEAQLAGLTA